MITESVTLYYKEGVNLMVIESVTLYYKEGSSDKFYIASIVEDAGAYSVPVTWGRRGTSGQSGYKVQGMSFDEAQKAYNKVVKEKTGKGYKVEGGMKPIKPYAGIPASAPVDSVNESLDNLDKIWETKKRKIDWKDGGEKVDKGGYEVFVPATGKIFSGLLPQLLNEIEESDVEKYIADSNYCAQEKHDGKRRMLRYEAGKTEGINKKGQIVGYPAVFEGACRELSELNGGLHDFVLDGEEVGETFYAFDLLSIKGDGLKGQTYRVRYGTLEGLSIQNGSMQVVGTAYTTKDKRALYERLKKDGKEGIVFKLLDGKHKVGYGPDQIKFKFRGSASVIVTGHNKKNSISVAVLNECGKLVPVGNITMIGHVRPPVDSIVECSFLYFFPGGSLYQPSYIGVRDDVNREDCLLSKLKCKAPVEE